MTGLLTDLYELTMAAGYFETGKTDLLVLGADGSLGRDEFLRLLYGGRVSLQVALISTFFVMLIGVTMGAVAGYYRGWVDTIVARLTEITMAFPALLFIIALASTAGSRRRPASACCATSRGRRRATT